MLSVGEDGATPTDAAAAAAAAMAMGEMVLLPILTNRPSVADEEEEEDVASPYYMPVNPERKRGSYVYGVGGP